MFPNDSFHKNVKQHNRFSFVMVIRNVFLAEKVHIIMISEGSCDTEDSSNDAENSALHHKNILHFKIYSNRKLLF